MRAVEPLRSQLGSRRLGGIDVGRIVGYAPGAYDLFHVGHLNLLKHAKTQCDYLVAGVVSDEKCERTKGIRPFVPLRERAEIVRHIVYVDEVYEEHVATKLEAWGDVRFDRIFKGDDWRDTSKGQQLEQDFAGVGVEVVYLPYTMHTSSSMLRRALSRLMPSEEELRSY
jgi:glycerol-3-phosphate cytidylyltransferase